MPCAVISAPVHVQDFPARYSPQMGFEGANVLFDTWVHPLMMGLEEHLLTMFREDFEFHDEAAPSHLGGGPRRAAPDAGQPRRQLRCADAARRRSPALDAGRREGTRQNSVLRARQGAPQHRALRARAGRRDHHRRDAVRCQSAFRPLTPTPVRVVIVTMDSHWPARSMRAPSALRARLPGLELVVHAADEWGSDPAALEACLRRHRARRHRHRDDAVPRGPYPRGAAGAARRGATHCDAMLCCLSAGEMVQADPARPVQHVGEASGALGAAEAAARQARRAAARSGAGPDEDAAPAAEAAALHPGHRAGCARLFPGAAILAGGLGGEHRQHGAACWSTATPTGPRARAARHARVGAAGRVSGCRPLSPARAGPHRRAARAAARPAASAGTVGAADAAVLCAGRQCRPLRRRDRGARGARACASSRPSPAGSMRAPAIERYFLRDGVPTVDAVVSLTGFSLVGGPAYNDARAAEDAAGAARRALHRRPSGRIPDAGAVGGRSARPDAGRGDDDGRDPGARRRRSGR